MRTGPSLRTGSSAVEATDDHGSSATAMATTSNTRTARPPAACPAHDPSRGATAPSAVPRVRSAATGGVLDPLDVGAERAQPRHQLCVAAVDVVDVADEGLALGDQAGHHPGGAGADVQPGQG